MTLTNNPNPVLDKQYIKDLIQIILNKNHTSGSKRSIRDYPDKFNFACPICGDSHKTDSKKRGNLYFKNMMYICYNENSCSRSFTKLLSTFGIEMDLDKRMEMYDYIEKNIQFTKRDDVTLTSLDKLIPLEEVIKFFSRDITHGLTDLKPLEYNSPVEYHVRNVRQIKNTRDIYEGIYHFSPKWKQPVMVFLNRMGDKVISFQVRNLLEGEKRYFKIFDFTFVYDMMYPENDLDEQERISYNKLSHFFNIFNIDFTQKVNVFEGYADSLFLPNSIGQIGVNTDITFLLNEEGIDIRFIYDNDGAGNKKTEKMLIDGRTVFLWNKFFLDMLRKHKGDRQQMARLLSENVKDFNKLAVKIGRPIDYMFNWDEYFSNSIMDKIYLMNLVDLTKMQL